MTHILATHYTADLVLVAFVCLVTGIVAARLCKVGLALVALILAASSVGFAWAGPGRTLLVLGLALVLRLAWWAFAPSSHMPTHRVRYQRIRVWLRLHPGRGHATALELHRRWGRLASFRESSRTRRSLPFRERLLHPALHSIRVGRAHLRHWLRIPVQESVLVLGPPRSGKSGLVADVVARYPGPVLSTSTKPDVFWLTSGLRARVGPVHVFNPQGIGAVPSTFHWSPLDGCEDPEVAIRRADGFANAISMGGIDDSSFWTSKAGDYLRGLFHAAALIGGDMRLVAHWALTEGASETAEIILWQAGRGEWAKQIAELRGPAAKTISTIRMTMTRALSFMNDPALMQAVIPGPEGSLDIETMLRDCGVLYMVAESRGDESPLAPLFACLANEVRYTAERIGSRMPGGRLDPTLLMALDEITQTCPVPLDKWLADLGGKGVQIVPVVHGIAQLVSRWGKDGSQVILDTSGTVMFLGGIKDTDTLAMASKLCGTVSMEAKGHEGRQQEADVMTPAMVRQLPTRRALVIRSGFSPVIAALPQIWYTIAYRRIRFAGQAVAAIEPAPVLALTTPRFPTVESLTAGQGRELELADPGIAPGPDGEPEPSNGRWPSLPSERDDDGSWDRRAN